MCYLTILLWLILFLFSGGQLPFEAIFVSCEDSWQKPTALVLHGGPHSTSVSGYSKSSAFLTSLGFNLLIVNYRYVSRNFSAFLSNDEH